MRAAVCLSPLLVAVWIACGPPQGQPDQAAVIALPGARAAVDAAAFPSLQEAINALPAEGGVINLPAGSFEITRPLVISQEDVLFRGSGTGTHIHNANTAGENIVVNVLVNDELGFGRLAHGPAVVVFVYYSVAQKKHLHLSKRLYAFLDVFETELLCNACKVRPGLVGVDVHELVNEACGTK